MTNLTQIETELKEAMKAKDPVMMGVLRGLKTRLQNERISKTLDLTEQDILNIIRSELKKRKESAESFKAGGRQEMADKELQEAEILKKYLPAQMSEEELVKIITQVLVDNSFTSQDFGKAMGTLKAKVGNNADNALLAKLLKEKLK